MSVSCHKNYEIYMIVKKDVFSRLWYLNLSWWILIIFCRIIEGIPKPTIQWYFQPEDGENFEEISETNNVLMLQDVDFNKVGTYLCIARNEIGNERYAIDLIVEC